MKFTKDSFDKSFFEKFSNKNQQYILDFCNTFQKTFPGILDEKTIIERISVINSINEKPKLEDGANGNMDYWNYNIEYRSNQSEIDERNTVYHELMHALSLRKDGVVNKFAGLTSFDSSGDWLNDPEMFDEIMNEFYVIKMLETERTLEEKNVTQKGHMYEMYPVKDMLKYYGNGYIKKVQLAEMLDHMYGKDLLKAKLIDRTDFFKNFNERYSNVEIQIPTNAEKSFEKEPTQMDRFMLNLSKMNVFKNFETILDLWVSDEKKKLECSEFELYSYLQDTCDIISYLPVREDESCYRTDRGNIGIPEELYRRIFDLDVEIAMKYIRPDLLNIQDETTRIKEINKVANVLNILRENIQDLSKEDIALVSYGKIDEYSYSGQDCIIINANDHKFLTTTSNSKDGNGQFTPYSKFKKLKEFTDFGYTQEQENEVRKELKAEGYEIGDFTYATIRDGIRHPFNALVESEGNYYTVTGKIEKVELKDIQTLGIEPEQIEELSQTEGISNEDMQNALNALKEELSVDKEKSDQEVGGKGDG